MAKKAQNKNDKNQGESFSFKFGEPESVLSQSIVDYLGVFVSWDSEYYEPPISRDGLAKITDANAYHGPLINFKARQLAKYFKPSKYLSRDQIERLAIDYETFGEFYVQILRNAFKQIIGLRHLPALSMRVGKKPGQFLKINGHGKEHTYFKPGEVIHIKQYDVKQGLYGKPSWYGAFHSILLDEDSTLFRRKYYVNGAHMGYIFFSRDPNISSDDEQRLKRQVQDSKGAGNFRSLYVNVPNGDKDAIQIIPVGDISTKDEFERIKKITRNDMLSAHAVYPELAAIVTEEKNGGDYEKINRVYWGNETVPRQQKFEQINELLGIKAIDFIKPEFVSEQAA